MKFGGDQTWGKHIDLSTTAEFQMFFSEFRDTKSATVSVDGPGQLFTLVNCWFLATENDRAVRFSNIQEGHIINCWTHGDMHLLGADDVTVADSRFDGDGDLAHLYLPSNNATAVDVHDCYFRHESGGGPMIWVQSSESSLTDRGLKFHHNSFFDDSGNSVTAVDIGQNITETEIKNNTFGANVGSAFTTDSGATVIARGNKGYITENGGEASVSDADTIAHGLDEIPTVYTVEATADGHIAVVTAADATNLTIGLHDDGGNAVTADETVSWEAKASSYYGA